MPRYGRFVSQTPVSCPRAGRLALLAATVLLGVLAMTWFAPQRAAHADGAGTTPHAASAAHHALGHDHAATSHLDEHDENDHSHALDLLLGFLVVLLGVALLSVWSRRPRRPMVILRRVRVLQAFTGRPPDPPSLTRLSIQRC